MIYLQIHGLLNWIPLKKQINKIFENKINQIQSLKGERRGFSNTHLTQVNNNVGMVKQPNPSAPLIAYQRNIDEIRLMETNSLTKAMMQSSKSGFHKKNIWDKYIARSLELKDKLSIKNMSIIMISAAKSNIKERKFYEQMSERIVTKCENYINAYKVDPKRYFMEDFRSEFTAFNVYTILSACTIAGYRDEKMFKMLYKVSEIKLLWFKRYLDTKIRLVPNAQFTEIMNRSEKDDKFTFEDVAGIVYAYSISNVEMPQMVKKYSEIFKKMYNISKNRESNEITKIGDVSPKAFAITVNSLVNLGDRSGELYRIGLEYLLRKLDELSTKDMIMIFSSIVKISTSGLNVGKEEKTEIMLENGLEDQEKWVSYQEEEHGNYTLVKVTEKIIERLSGLKVDPESLVNLTSTMVKILKLGIFSSEERFEDMRSRFNKLFTELSYHVVAENEPDSATLIQLISNSAILGTGSVSMMLISDPRLKSVGLVESIRDISQFLVSLGMIHTKTSSTSAKDLINELVLMTVRQYGKRLNYVLYPSSMQLSKTRARPTGLYDILKLESKGLLDVKADDINKDWEMLTRELVEIRPENIIHLASMLSVIGKFKPCKDFVNFITLSKDYITKFIKFYSQECTHSKLQLDTVSAIVNTLSRYRIKNNQLMMYFSKLIKSQVDNEMELGGCEIVNNVVLFNIISSYAKLGFPKNNMLTAKNGYKRMRKLERNYIHNQLFRSISNVLSLSRLERINLQMVTNCLYSLSLVGYDKFSRITLMRLFDRFIKTFPNQGVRMSKHDSNEVNEKSHISEYIKQLDRTSEEGSSGEKEMYSQVNIIIKMLNLMVKNNYFKSRLFEKYFKKIKKMVLKHYDKGGNYKDSSNQMCKFKEFKPDELYRGNTSAVANKMSGLHRSVLSYLKNNYKAIESEVEWMGGAYYIDIVIKDGRIPKYVEIDGAYHYYSQSTEMLSSSKVKHYIITRYGHNLIHLPYFEWAKCENDDERVEYLSRKLRDKIELKSQ